MEINNLIDLHCHLDLYPDHREAVANCERDKIRTIAVTTTPRAWPQNRDFTKHTHYVRPALGLHPQLIKSDATKELMLWESYFPEARYIGEVGIDASPDSSQYLTEQKRVFIRMLQRCAKAGDKILSVHSVRSAGIVLDLIEAYLPYDRGKVILHWFTGNITELKRAVSLGCYFSINVAMLQSKRGIEILNTTPFERIVTETDGPFIHLRNKIATPADNIQLLAKITQQDERVVAGKVFSNLKTMLEG